MGRVILQSLLNARLGLAMQRFTMVHQVENTCTYLTAISTTRTGYQNVRQEVLRERITYPCAGALSCSAPTKTLFGTYCTCCRLLKFSDGLSIDALLRLPMSEAVSNNLDKVHNFLYRASALETSEDDIITLMLSQVIGRFRHHITSITSQSTRL